MKNKVIFLVPDTSYDSLYNYYDFIAKEMRKHFPIEAEAMFDWIGLDITKLEEELKNGAKLILVNGALICEPNPRIEAFIDRYSDRICVYFKDNPVNYTKNIELIKGRLKVFVSDNAYGRYLKKYYKIESLVIINPAVGVEQDRPYLVRSEETIFVGSYYDPKGQLSYIEENVPEVFREISDNIIAKIDADCMVDIEKCIIDELDRIGKAGDKALVRDFVSTYAGYYLEYQCRLIRYNVITGLLKRHCVVAVAGKNWEAFRDSLPSKLTRTLNVQAAVPVGPGVSLMMSHVKGVLSIEPGHSEGCHERIGAGLIAGCPVFALDTPFTRELAAKTEGVKVFNPDNIGELSKMIAKAQKGNGYSECIPESLSLGKMIDAILTELYGKAYEDKFIKDEHKSIVKDGKIAYIRRGKDECLLLNDEKTKVESAIYLEYVTDRLKPTSIYTAVVSGTNDVLKCFSSFKNKVPYKVYYVPADYRKALDYIKAFKLEKKLQKRLIMFKSREDLRNYLLNHDEEYLPRLYLGDVEYFAKMTEELHNIRLESPRNPKIKPFLTIAVPSYNRGKSAMNTIKKILRSEFDSEIEILISDNGSEIGAEEYKKISKIKDSRLKYSRNKENLRFAGNIIKLTKLGRGTYIYFSSDEDDMYTGNLHIILDGLITEGDVDFIGVAALGRDYHVNQIINDYRVIFDNAINSNYITGTFFNLSHLSKKKITEIAERYKDNEFFIYYPHLVYAILAIKKSRMATFTTELYKERDEENDAVQGLVRLNKAEHREQMADAAIEIILNEIDVYPSLKIELIAERMTTAYRLVNVGHYNLKEAYKEAGITLEDDYASLDEWRDKRLIELIKCFDEDYREELVRMVLEGSKAEKERFAKATGSGESIDE